jgi:2-dehydro-3-deoxygluconokinase
VTAAMTSQGPSATPTDIVCLGEVMLRLAPPRHQRLRTARHFDVVVAGSQFNVAADLAGLGLRAQFVTKLPANELGRLVLDTCRGYGVDVSHVLVESGGRLGLNFVELGASPHVQIVYDRAASSASSLVPDDIDWRALTQSTRSAYTDGILLGLSDGCRAAGVEFLRAGRSTGALTIFDANYRHHLWASPAQAAAAWSAALEQVDVVVTNRTVSEQVHGMEGSDEAVLREHQRRFGCRVVVLTSRTAVGSDSYTWSSIAVDGDQLATAQPITFAAVDRYGTGDAWLAGFVYGLLRDVGLPQALALGAAYGRLAHGFVGDVVQLDPETLEQFAADRTASTFSR